MCELVRKDTDWPDDRSKSLSDLVIIVIVFTVAIDSDSHVIVGSF